MTFLSSGESNDANPLLAHFLLGVKLPQPRTGPGGNGSSADAELLASVCFKVSARRGRRQELTGLKCSES